MQSITVSATKARNEFFDILSKVGAGASFVVEKDRKKVAEIIPVASDMETWEEKKKRMIKVLDEVSGSWKGIRFRSPLRGKKARAWLGRWDKDIGF